MQRWDESAFTCGERQGFRTNLLVVKGLSFNSFVHKYKWESDGNVMGKSGKGADSERSARRGRQRGTSERKEEREGREQGAGCSEP